jgi:hypothetical protein
MAIYFQLISNGSDARFPASEAATFNAVDEAVCADLGVACSKEEFYAGWYDIIGFALASGRSYAVIESYLKQDADKGSVKAQKLLAVNTWLSERFNVDNWSGQ